MESEKETEMTLWQEMFNQPVFCEFTRQEFNEAWNWLFADKETASLKLAVARRHSLLLKRAGGVRTAEMAVIGLMSRSGNKSLPTVTQERNSGIKLPVRILNG